MHFLNQRSKEKELLDNLSLSGKELTQSLEQLAFINRFLGNTSSILQAIENLTLKNSLKTGRIIDLGCGGGDILIALEKKLRRKQLSIQLIGIDGNPHSLAHAASKAGKDSDIEFICQDILAEAFILPACDILISSHFIYHFEEEELIRFIRKHKNNVSNTILFSELIRNRFAFILFRIFSQLLGFNQIVRKDGLLAIQRAYTHKELNSLFTQAKFHSPRIQNKWLFRMLIYLNSSNL